MAWSNRLGTLTAVISSSLMHAALVVCGRLLMLAIFFARIVLLAVASATAAAPLLSAPGPSFDDLLPSVNVAVARIEAVANNLSPEWFSGKGRGGARL